MTRRETIRIDYPGSVISVNHYLSRRKGGGYYVNPETKIWKEQFQWLLKGYHLEDWQLPLDVTCSGYFKDERSAPDISNLSKVILDSIEELTGINDKNMRWHDGARVVGVDGRGFRILIEKPYLRITIKGGATPLPIVPSKSTRKRRTE